jgi:hypothetical protein
LDLELAELLLQTLELLLLLLLVDGALG